MKYRPEIDGLRGIAVIAVFLFHLFPHCIPGGFLGVDIFFVISGFLITSIVKNQYQEKRFTFKDFWLHRINRLFPPMAFTIFLTLFTGIFLLFPSELKNLGSQSLAVLLLIANIKMWQTTSYWDPSSDDIPLLHTWSLAVEEQFYITFIFIFIALLKFLPKRINIVFFILSAISFLIATINSASSNPASFYLLPARVWELLSGCILALHLNTFKPKWKCLSPYFISLSIIALLASCLFFTRESISSISLIWVITNTIIFIYFSAHNVETTKSIMTIKPLVFTVKLVNS